MVEALVTPALPVGPLSLFLDVDGTLIEIAPRPDAVVVPPTLVATLAALDARLGGALALVSGRTIGDIDALFDPLRLRASGIHGAEVRTTPDGAVTRPTDDRLPSGVAAAIRALAAAHADTIVEDKGVSMAVHFRANPAAGPALEGALTRLAADAGSDLQVLPGHMVFEVKHTAYNKGLAIAGLMARAPFAGRKPIFIGDDVTDMPGFETVLAAGGLAYSVLTRRPGLSGHFDDPGQVRAWLDALAAHRR